MYYKQNCEIEFDLLWSNNCVISETLKTAAVDSNPNANSPVQVSEQHQRILCHFK